MRTTNGRPEPIKWRPFRRPSRLVPTAAIITALIAAIALANGWGNSQPAQAEDSPTAGIPHSRQGAQQAATTMARALGTEAIYDPAARHDLVDTLVHPSQRDEMQKRMDAQYTAFNQKIGLDSKGQPPAGATFASRTMPAGVTLRSYGEDATVDVWFSSLFGLTGSTVVDEIPMDTGWYTMTMTLRWADDDGWKLIKFTQQDGPEPDNADSIGEAPQP
ncbi:hypothetical protein ACH40E_38010 [Streptomyces acidicola]|uniref:hypothetical protein n=1 Tax=Streptomyces acidicola TaxID=2596892 RepID=UPI0037B903A8